MQYNERHNNYQKNMKKKRTVVEKERKKGDKHFK